MLIERYAPSTEAEDSPSHTSECTSRSNELSGPLPPQSPWLPTIRQYFGCMKFGINTEFMSTRLLLPY